MEFLRIPTNQHPKRDACVQTLLEQARPPDHGLFAIVDLAAVDTPRVWLNFIRTRCGGANLFQGQPEASAVEQAAWLVPIEGSQDRSSSILCRSVNEAMLHQAVCWLTSRLPLPELSTRLARRMSVQTPDGEALLRYYDARLTCAFWNTLSSAQRDAFGAIGSTWWHMDAAMSVQRIELSGAVSDMPDTFQPPLHFDDAQTQALLRVSEWHQLIGLLRKRQPERFASLDRARQLQLVKTHDVAARDRQVTHLADRLRYCELALQHGEDFSDHMRWQPVWHAMQTPGTRLQSAMERLNPIIEST